MYTVDTRAAGARIEVSDRCIDSRAAGARTKVSDICIDTRAPAARYTNTRYTYV